MTEIRSSQRLLAIVAGAALSSFGAIRPASALDFTAPASPTAPTALAALAERAATGDLAAARELRAAGPDGLSAMLDAGVTPVSRWTDPGYRRALDVVCAQVDCHASRLFWYTDLDAAARAAAASGKPLLVLRLLGRLDEEWSCANSRYFRALLYSDPQIAERLRDRVVLAWSSQRPVPRVEIDFGDGRRLEGTVTGNSIHYLVDVRGRLVDGLPGLHTPARFAAWLDEVVPMAVEWGKLPDDRFRRRASGEHERLADERARELVAMLVERGWDPEQARAAWVGPPSSARTDRATAGEAAAMALTKSSREAPLLEAIGLGPDAPQQNLAISQLALTRQWNAQLSPQAKALISARAPELSPDEVESGILWLENEMARDGLFNEGFLHRALHTYLGSLVDVPRWQTVDDWVYTTLFLSRPDDPWMGLSPAVALGSLRPVAAP